MAKFTRKNTKVSIRTILNSEWNEANGKMLFGYEDLEGQPKAYLRVFITRSDKSFDTFGNEGDITDGDLEIQIFTHTKKSDPDDAETIVELLDTILNRRVVDSGSFYFDRSRVLFNSNSSQNVGDNSEQSQGYNMSNYSISFRIR